MRTGNRCKTSKHIQTLVNTNNLPCVDAHARRIYLSSCHVATDHYTCCHTVTHSNAQTYIHRGALFCGRPKQLFMMGNTRHPYRPSPVIVTHRGGCVAPDRTIRQRPGFQTTRRTQNHLILHSWFVNNRHTHTQAREGGKRQRSAPKPVHAHGRMRTALHMLKPLSCCLLSHYSIACYFLKQEKAIHPQRSAERFATRLSLGMWEVTLKSEECGEV